MFVIRCSEGLKRSLHRFVLVPRGGGVHAHVDGDGYHYEGKNDENPSEYFLIFVHNNY